MAERSKVRKSFAEDMNFYKLFWIFFIGCFAGFVGETIWCLATLYHFESRAGVIYGPFNPVYGFGALIVIICMYKLRYMHDLWIFLCSMIIGSVFEYMCSLFQELTFSTISWEYSNTQLNLHGRTNIMFAFMWGVLGVIWVKDVFPCLSRLIEKIPNSIGVVLTWILLIFMLLNMGISALAVKRQTDRKNNMNNTDVVSQFLDKYFTDDFLAKIYPNMTTIPKKDGE